jgi:hypothetical protein
VERATVGLFESEHESSRLLSLTGTPKVPDIDSAIAAARCHVREPLGSRVSSERDRGDFIATARSRGVFRGAGAVALSLLEGEEHLVCFEVHQQDVSYTQSEEWREGGERSSPDEKPTAQTSQAGDCSMKVMAGNFTPSVLFLSESAVVLVK